MNFDGIILDIDGTIWNTTGVVAKAWNRAIENNFPQVPRVTADILKGQFGKPMNVIADNLFTGLDDDQKKVLMRACEKEEEKEISQNETNITYEGVAETIEKLFEKIPLFIVSNCQKGYIELVMKKNNITKYITDFESYGNTGKQKWENIVLIENRNNLKHPVYVGDTQGDFDSCMKAGIDFIFASYGFGKINENDQKNVYKTIKNFSELLFLV